MAISFSGLSSGIDSASLIDSLVNAEKAQASAYTKQKSNLDGQKSVVSSLSTSLAAFGSLAKSLKSGVDLQPRKATSSDAHVTVAVSSSATPTTHSVRVTQTARAQVLASRTFPTPDAGQLGDGGVTIGGKSVTWGATDTLGDIASKINNADAGVTASVLNDGSSYRLVVTSKDTGIAGAPAIVDSGDGLALGIPGAVKQSARDAIVEIDGITVTRSRNVIDDAITGVTITAVSPHGATEADGAITVANDSAAVKTKLDAFVKAYNGIASALKEQLGYSGDGSTQKSGATLFGDSTLRALQGRVATMMSSSYGGATLGGIGLSRDKDGFMAIDTTKLEAALAKDPTAAAKLFATGGFAADVAKLSDDYARGGDGILAVKTASLTAQGKTAQSQIDRIDASAEALRVRLEMQFAKLESAMSMLKSQSSRLTAMFG